MVNRYSFDTKDEWLEFRKAGIGGSEAAALFDESPYMSETDLAASKLTATTQDDSPILSFGNRMESVIFNEFVLRDYEFAVAFNNSCFVNDDYPHLQASPDALTDTTVIEIKFINLYGTAKWKGDSGNYELPRHYWHQVQHYMTVFKKKEAVVYAFFQELDDVVKFTVEWDETYAYQLNVKATDFIEKLNNGEYSTDTDNTRLDIVIPEKELVDLNSINNNINKLNMKKKAITDRLLSKYPAGVKLSFKDIKAGVYERSGKTYLRVT